MTRKVLLGAAAALALLGRDGAVHRRLRRPQLRQPLAGQSLTTVTGGVRVNFGTGSLVDLSTNGALFDTQNFFLS